jgi:hypothetical protein
MDHVAAMVALATISTGTWSPMYLMLPDCVTYKDMYRYSLQVQVQASVDGPVTITVHHLQQASTARNVDHACGADGVNPSAYRLLPRAPDHL